MPIVITPTKKKKKMSVKKEAFKGGGGMDIATKRDALVSSLTKTAKQAMTGTSRLSDQDVARAMSMARGMISPTAKKAKGGKIKK